MKGILTVHMDSGKTLNYTVDKAEYDKFMETTTNSITTVDGRIVNLDILKIEVVEFNPGTE